MEENGTVRITGMRAFWLVWFGQLISLLGSSMTQFAITIWAYEQTHQATSLALIGVFFMVPLLVMSPIVGVLVDRYDRKLMMMLSDLAAGIATIAIFTLYIRGDLQVWHLYIASVINGIFSGFQWPAFAAALSVMIPKDQYVRANGMMEIVGPGAGIAAPVLAGAIIGFAEPGNYDGLRVILLIDIITFSTAIGSLLLIYVPNPVRTEPVSDSGLIQFLREAIYGFSYIFARPSLLGLQLTFLFGNLLYTMTQGTLLAPMLLARTDSTAWIYGASQTIGGLGVVIGGIVIGAWGGFKRRVHGVLLGWALSFLFGVLLVGLGRAQPAWMMSFWAAGLFLSSAVLPLVNGSNQAIWMAKVAPDVQGRVFSTRRLIAWVANPVGALIAAPLADYVMEPAMQQGGSLAPAFGWLVGTGPGAGMSLIMIIVGIVGVLFSISMYLFSSVRDAETILPDHAMVNGAQEANGSTLEQQAEIAI
jgi:MFS transporter, DHA3 family, macrolide efflux protein